MIGFGAAMLVERDCSLVPMLSSSGRCIGKHALEFLLLNFSPTYDTHDMHRIPVLLFSLLRLFLHGYDDYEDQSYEFECRMSISSHCIHILLNSMSHGLYLLSMISPNENKTCDISLPVGLFTYIPKT